MVFFTCNACGDSLKKAQVDKHVMKCRGCQVLSCIDCGKDFWGDDYKNHLKCISEDQKYGGKGYEAKAKKGDVKQHQWIQTIHEAMNKPGVSPKLKEVLKQVSTYDNVPRKKAKFQNWMKNSLKIANSSLHEQVWGILNSVADNPSDVPQKNKELKEMTTQVEVDGDMKEKQNGHLDTKKKKLSKQERKEMRRQENGGNAIKTQVSMAEEEQTTKKKKGRKRVRGCEDDGNEDANDASDQMYRKKLKTDQKGEAADISEQSDHLPVAQGNFKWKETIKAVLRNSPDQELPVKKLRKKVLAAYFTVTGDGNFKTKEEVLGLFNKKINNNPKFRVLKDRVSLIK
ncbi:cell growth-regulating nucleolar protein [Dunckerocampus dactyliophorus]|uniref:cell growth-regulating nucleolar protein n=1 Tax=Dunckerocampus dactyliophorus TaxID=161453 RepID=UPI0024065882|nr:cell growth-regulating nucleolar protein [Dunckerocampus dactyliophorus]